MVLEDRDIQYLKRHLLRNNVVLFLGAGFSMAALNRLGEQLPSSKELAMVLWRYMNYPGDYDGTSLSILYQAALRKPGGTDPLFSLLRSKLIVNEYPEWYSSITRWFWYRIYTTNVDNLVELVFKERGGHIKVDQVVAPSEYQDRDAFLRSIQFVKLNGSLDRLDLGLTFAPKEYGRRAAEQDVWYDHFVRDFSTSPTLFVGSELDEPLLWQYIAIRQRRSRRGEKRAKSFLICPFISPAKREALSEYNVTPIETTAEEFFQELASQPDIIISRQELLQNLDPSLEEVIALEKMGLAVTEVELAEEFFRVFRPVKAEQVATGGRQQFHFTGEIRSSQGKLSGRRCKCRSNMKLRTTCSAAPNFFTILPVLPARNRFSTTICERQLAHKPLNDERLTRDVTHYSGDALSNSRPFTLSMKKRLDTLPFKFYGAGLLRLPANSTGRHWNVGTT